jgi:hypothetical protein
MVEGPETSPERRRLFHGIREAIMTAFMTALVLGLFSLFLSLVLNAIHLMPRLLDAPMALMFPVVVVFEGVRAGRLDWTKSLRDHRILNRLCQSCGYDLKANESSVCPECG